MPESVAGGRVSDPAGLAGSGSVSAHPPPLTGADLFAILQHFDPLPRAPQLGIVFVAASLGGACLKMLQPVQWDTIEGLFGDNADETWKFCKNLRNHEFALVLGGDAWKHLQKQLTHHTPPEIEVWPGGPVNLCGAPVVEVDAKPRILPLRQANRE